MELTEANENPKTNGASRAAAHDVEANVSSFLQRMYDPSVTRCLESRMSPTAIDLLHVPWKLKILTSDEEAHEKDEAKGHESTPLIYPPFNYLELRRIQNNAWATDRLKVGIRLAKEGKSKKAEECYKEGLDLVPTHAELFVAHGALCANLGRIEEAIDKLQHALELDPRVPNAQSYLNAIQTRQAPRKLAGSNVRSETAMRDALMERSFLSESRNSLSNQDEKYPLVYEDKAETNGDNEDRSRRKHHHKKDKTHHHDSRRDRSRHRKSRSRRKRRKHCDFYSNESEGDESRSQIHRKRRHQRRDSSQGRRHAEHNRRSTDETSEESNRRRRRKQHRRQRETSPYSSDASSERDRRKARRKESRRRRKHYKSRERSASQSRESQTSEKAVSHR